MGFEHSGGERADDDLHRIRHSLAHVMAQAVLEMRPGSTLGFGPPIEGGFYYDFALAAPIGEADFPEIERRMRKILKSGQRFYREELDAPAALARIDEMGEPYKREYAEELLAKKGLDGLSFYRNGPFLDMCEGPHVETTKEIPRDAFRLRSVAGAYWRGSSDNAMMTRIYAWAFKDKAALDAHVAAWQLAQERDHKKLGRELDIFHLDETVGRGLPLWLPNGAALREELEKFAKEMEFVAGYQRVASPHLARAELYRRSGHLPYYADDMFPLMELKEPGADGAAVRETYALRPMNCPHHHSIFAARPRSYRDLPLRLAEHGHVYRFEESGAVSGLVRVRGMCMNDAHIYCTLAQIKDEFKGVMQMHEKAYETLGLSNIRVRFSRWDPNDPKRREKYVQHPQAWAFSERIVQEVLEEMGLDYVDGPGEAAFYGPKLDIQCSTVTGREESIGTVQLDFAQPGRLGLKYVGADGAEHTPYCIHRAPLATHERMTAFLLEHFGGAFPTWLAPVQVQVITVSERFDAYARAVVARLRQRFVRAELASVSDTVSKKIRAGVTRKIPNLLIVGEREQADGTVTLRRHGMKRQQTLPLDDFEAWIVEQIANRTLADA